ncbi:MAG: metal ABC transporter substrate-binding protein [Muricoprocola sp.]
MRTKKAMMLGFMMATLSPVLGVQAEDDHISVVTTIFPEYDWMREIIGEDSDIELTMLLDKGTDLHNYQPSAEDMVKIVNADLFVYVGGESYKWVEEALANSENPEMKVVNLLEALGDTVKEEEVVEGMEAEAEEEHADEEEEDTEYDEHVWLSLRNAQTLCQMLGETMEELDPEHAQDYKANTESYVSELEALDEEYKAAVEAGNKDTILFGDRFPFRYMTEDYGLNYYAAFVGCSAETEASFETIAFLADKVKELGLDAILTIEGSDHKIAETISATSGVEDIKILSLDSMQSVTGKDVQDGADYVDIMKKNLEVLKEALQ